jgi:hypothetical protein
MSSVSQERMYPKVTPWGDLGGILITVRLAVTNTFSGAGIAVIRCNNLIPEKKYNSCHDHQQSISSEFFQQFISGHHIQDSKFKIQNSRFKIRILLFPQFLSPSRELSGHPRCIVDKFLFCQTEKIQKSPLGGI